MKTAVVAVVAIVVILPPDTTPVTATLSDPDGVMRAVGGVSSGGAASIAEEKDTGVVLAVEISGKGTIVWT